MVRRSRTRRVLKWIGTTACMLILVSDIVTLKWAFYWTSTDHQYILQLIAGAFIANWRDSRQPKWEGPYPTSPGFEFNTPYGDKSGPGLVGWWKSLARPFLQFNRRGFSYFSLPLWMPLLLVGALTAHFWWSDRRIPPGHCQTCGYDLTGNVSGRCPECGTPLQNAQTTSSDRR